MNFANVRPVTGAEYRCGVRSGRAAALACALAAILLGLLGPTADAGAREVERAPVVTLAALPPGTGLGELAEALPEAAVGLMSAGLGRAPAAQTWLDVGQGARTWGFLHDGDLPLGEDPDLPPGARRWRQVVDRARGAPAPLVPGLLAGTIRAAGLEVAVDRRPPGPGSGAIAALDTDGRIAFSARRVRARGGLLVLGSDLAGLRRLGSGAGARDVLIAVVSPPPPEGTSVPVAIAGAGLGGLLSSRATRIRGYVLSTDLAPTVLDRLGVPEPPEMEGSVLDAEPPRDIAGLLDLDRRMGEIGSRRASVAGLALGVWLLAALAWWLATRGSSRGRAGLALLALACAYLPALLLLTAALRPSAPVELGTLLVAGPGLALLTLRLVPGFGALAVACGVAVTTQLGDLAAGSALTSLSLLGPNPAVGARFFGIGNELVATYGVLVPVGVGAAIAALAPLSPARGQALAFVVAGVVVGLALGAGGLGASVGAAIVLGAGGAAAALAVAWPVRRLGLLLAAAAPVAAVGLVAASDIVLGGDAHLSRSVLEGAGLDGLAETVERRLRLAARSFARAQYLPFLVAMAPTCALAMIHRRTISRWLSHRAMRAGYVGGIAATLVGTVANDSGAMLLIGGFLWLALVTGFSAWARYPGARSG